MMIRHLSLSNFRNYTRLELDLPAGVSLFQGDNAQGKTNLLESIYYLATSRSPQAATDIEVVNWLVRGDPLAFARLVADVEQEGRTQRFELTLTPCNNHSAASAPNFRKQIRINGVPKRAMDLLGLLNVVIFRPQDIDLVAGGPGFRRKYLDVMLCQIDSRYCRALQLYNRVLNQRNCLLRNLREGRGPHDQLVYWDQRLAEHGAYVTARRALALSRLDRSSRDVHAGMTENGGMLHLVYQPSLGAVGLGPDAGAARDPAASEDWEVAGPVVGELSEAFQNGLERSRREEIMRGMTVLGPHRDDFRFLLAETDLTVYGSRGQQRTAALALKLAETELVRQVKGHWPVLLLDDVMSELDGQRRNRLLMLMDGASQTLVTTTDVDVYSESFLGRVARHRIQDGRVEPLQG